MSIRKNLIECETLVYLEARREYESFIDSHFHQLVFMKICNIDMIMFDSSVLNKIFELLEENMVKSFKRLLSFFSIEQRKLLIFLDHDLIRKDILEEEFRVFAIEIY